MAMSTWYDLDGDELGARRREEMEARQRAIEEHMRSFAQARYGSLSQALGQELVGNARPSIPKPNKVLLLLD